MIAADAESVDAIGPNPLDPARRAVSYAAGLAQAERAAEAVGEFWR